MYHPEDCEDFRVKYLLTRAQVSHPLGPPPLLPKAIAAPTFPSSGLDPPVHIVPDRSCHSRAVLRDSSFRPAKILPWSYFDRRTKGRTNEEQRKGSQTTKEKDQGEYGRRGAGPPSSTSPPECRSSSSLGPIALAAVLQPALVSSKNPMTASVALKSPSNLTVGALGRSNSQCLPTLSHSLFICGAHALRSTNRWWRGYLLPQLHHQHSLDSNLCVPVIRSRRKGPMQACPDKSWQCMLASDFQTRLSCFCEGWSPRGGGICAPARHAMPSGPGASLCCGSEEVGKASLPPVLIRHRLGPTSSRLPRESVRLLVAGDFHMGWHPKDRDVIASAGQARTDLNGCPGWEMTRAEPARLNPTYITPTSLYRAPSSASYG